MTTPFDLVTVIIQGEEVLARPIEWDRAQHDRFGNDKDGTPMQPTVCVTTCPHCGGMVQFNMSDRYNGDHLKCTNCNAGAADEIVVQAAPPPPPLVPPVVVPTAIAGIQVLRPATPEAHPVLPVEVALFTDPIAAKLVNTDNYA